LNERMAAPPVTRRDAEAALAQHDWIVCQVYGGQRLEDNATAGLTWLDRLEAEALPAATAGDKVAQGVVGHVYVERYVPQGYSTEGTLVTALAWFARAGRQDGGEPMIEELRYWYLEGKAKGLLLAEAEWFLREPDIRERYRQYGGRDTL
jgi:hypothetical protein